MAIIISRSNFGRKLTEKEQRRLNLADDREVARTLEQVLRRLQREADDGAKQRAER